LQMIDSTIVRAHRCAAGKQSEKQKQALGRSRGGFSTKIHLRCNAAGLPIGVVLSEGEAHDVTAYDGLMQQRDSDPGAMLADKGYDSDAIRHDLQDSGATPEIPTKRNRKVQYSVSKPLYALRSRIECFIGHLKEQRRIATRYDKLATSFVGFVLLGCIRIWIRANPEKVESALAATRSGLIQAVCWLGGQQAWASPTQTTCGWLWCG
jgi:transposase